MHETKNHQITNFKIPQSFGNQRNFQQYTAKLKVPVASAGRVSCFTGHGSFNAVAASWCCAAVGLHFFCFPQTELWSLTKSLLFVGLARTVTRQTRLSTYTKIPLTTLDLKLRPGQKPDLGLLCCTQARGRSWRCFWLILAILEFNERL